MSTPTAQEERIARKNARKKPATNFNPGFYVQKIIFSRKQKRIIISYNRFGWIFIFRESLIKMD